MSSFDLPTELFRWALISAVILSPQVATLAIFCAICAVSGFISICFRQFYLYRKTVRGSPTLLDINAQLIRVAYHLVDIVTYFLGFLLAHFLWLGLYDFVCALHLLCERPLYWTLDADTLLFIGALGWCAVYFGGSTLYEGMEASILKSKQ